VVKSFSFLWKLDRKAGFLPFLAGFSVEILPEEYFKSVATYKQLRKYGKTDRLFSA
jgi:hypothetical protein